jgi:hypothetical protein
VSGTPGNGQHPGAGSGGQEGGKTKTRSAESLVAKTFNQHKLGKPTCVKTQNIKRTTLTSDLSPGSNWLAWSAWSCCSTLQAKQRWCHMNNLAASAQARCGP